MSQHPRPTLSVTSTATKKRPFDNPLTSTQSTQSSASTTSSSSHSTSLPQPSHSSTSISIRIDQLLQNTPSYIIHNYDISLASYLDQLASHVKTFANEDKHKSTTALDLFNALKGDKSSHLPQSASPRPKFITSTLIPLDNILTSSILQGTITSPIGGFKTGQITELVGRAGVGKTNLAMQVAIGAVSCGGKVVYIDTEKKFSVRRLMELSDGLFRQFCDFDGDNDHANEDDNDKDQFMYSFTQSDESSNKSKSNESSKCFGINPTLSFKPSQDILPHITIYSPRDTPELISILLQIQKQLLSSSSSKSKSNSNDKPTTLLVVDSIASLSKLDFDPSAKLGSIHRADAIFKVTQIMKQIAEDNSLAVLATNQIALASESSGSGTSTSTTNRYGANSVSGDSTAVMGQMGTIWHHCVSTRLLLEYESDPFRQQNSRGDVVIGEEEKRGRGVRRKATVVKSSCVRRGEVGFEILGGGISILGEMS